MITDFQKVPMSDVDLLGAQVLPLQTEAMITNLRVDIAISKINLEFTPNDPLGYAQQEAYLRGQLDILQFLQDNSTTAAQTLKGNES